MPNLRGLPFHPALRMLVLAAAYALTGRIGLAFPQIGFSITLLWVPAGIAIALLHRWGLGCWPGVFAGAVLVNLWVGSPPLTSLLIAVGNTLGPVAATLLLRRGGFESAMRRRRDVVLFALAAGAGLVLSALGGAGTLAATGTLPGDDFPRAALTWWGGDTLGALLVGPLLLTLSRESVAGLRARGGESLAWLAVSALLMWATFGVAPGHAESPLIFVAVLPLAWAAMRFGPFGASLSALLLSLGLVWAESTGRGAWSLGDGAHGLFMLWSWMAILVVVGLMITALQAERASAEREARLNEQRLRLALQSTDTALFDWNIGSGAIFLSREWSLMLGGPPAETRSTLPELAAIVHPEDRDAVNTALRELVKGERGGYRLEHRIRSSAGDWIWIEVQGRVVERDGDGRALRALGVAKPVTERKLAEAALRESRERFEQLTELTSDWYWEQDADFRFTAMEGNLQKKTGIAASAHLGKARWEMPALNMTEEDWARHRAMLTRHEPFYDLEMRRPDTDGRQHWVSISGRPRFDRDGRFIGYRGIGQDITARKLAEEALRASEAKFATAFRSSPNPISISTVADGRYLDVNQAYLDTTGYAREDVVGQLISDVGLWVDPAGRVRLLDLLREERRVRNLEVRLRRKSGEIMLCELSGELIDIDGTPCFLAVTADVTARKLAEQKIRDLARMDALTGVAQRGYFLDLLGHAFALAERNKSSLAVLFIDLDQFKDINDAHGHAAGDQVLRLAAGRIRATLRTSDIVGRLGGDEFVVVLEQCGDRVDVAIVANKLHAAFDLADPAESHGVRISISVGVALYPDDAGSVDELLARADAAMYQAKRAGRNQVRFYVPGD